MKKLFVWIFLTSSIFFFSCEDETDSGIDVNSDEAKLEVDLLADKASADITRLTESDGAKGALDLLNLLEDFDFNARNNEAVGVRERLHIIAQYFVYGPSARVGEDEPFSFDDIKGLYVWNSETGSFDESSSEFFIVVFPTDGSEINNGELKISSLEFVTIIDNHEGNVDEYQLPIVIDAYLKIDEVEVITLDFVVSWSADGFPEKADVELFVSPFTFILGFDQTFSNTSSSLVTSVRLDGETIIGIDVDVDFETEVKEDPSFVEGSVQYYNLKISGNADILKIEEEENGDINDFVNLELLLDDEKIGDIIFEEDIAYVLYVDGSKELLEEIIQNVVDDIGEFFGDFEEDEDLD